MNMDSMVERVARAIYIALDSKRAALVPWSDLPPTNGIGTRDACIEAARDAIEEMRNLTNNMIDATTEKFGCAASGFTQMYETAIDEALK